MKERIKKVIEQRKKLNMNDDMGIQKCWEDITDILSENEEDTIAYLNNCDKDELYWISEVFEDISENLQSQEFIECLRRLDVKFPELDMTKDIDLAEEYIM
ncbi:hypothetical protein [Clostridium septicum]|uniref:Uncharacterized protein n=1 Tax=Clostridium septicum TaxID=1504 RepID=A0A9N7JKY5_CLOSE|nr:hypothetical protein [Clostridium septicum]AYE33969.1 hypothetical protein CP523_05515 [Clostridium septicum]MDU1315434.1 hypothetical protein [Clostridium septicum]QAS59360.1 hypothetical protein EI377_00135 [Clostridium septicum]UEC21417.1 hypothetical protein LK444_03320 [Clostridium septicum]USS00536.1 hypothetical protein NH397_13765 [Clostridium septicum]